MINLLIIFLVKVFYMVGTPLSPSIKELGDGLSQNCSSRWNSTCFSGDGSGVRLMRGGGEGRGRGGVYLKWKIHDFVKVFSVMWVLFIF